MFDKYKYKGAVVKTNHLQINLFCFLFAHKET